jgi:hypothetical protein
MEVPAFESSGAIAAIGLFAVAVCAMMLSMAMHWCCP